MLWIKSTRSSGRTDDFKGSRSLGFRNGPGESIFCLTGRDIFWGYADVIKDRLKVDNIFILRPLVLDTQDDPGRSAEER
jgi:hypothetical protein